MASSYSLGAHFEGFVKRLLESGRYNNASEVLRDSLRLLEEREAFNQAKLEALRKDVDAGLESGPAQELDMGELKVEGRRRKAARRGA